MSSKPPKHVASISLVSLANLSHLHHLLTVTSSASFVLACTDTKTNFINLYHAFSDPSKSSDICLKKITKIALEFTIGFIFTQKRHTVRETECLRSFTNFNPFPVVAFPVIINFTRTTTNATVHSVHCATCIYMYKVGQTRPFSKSL